MTPDEYCQEKAAQSGSSFYYSFLFLPPRRRRAITALYAFCREVDDVVDECTDAAVARNKLAWWRKEIAKPVCRYQRNTPSLKRSSPSYCHFALAQRISSKSLTAWKWICNLTAIRISRRCKRIAIAWQEWSA